MSPCQLWSLKASRVFRILKITSVHWYEKNIFIYIYLVLNYCIVMHNMHVCMHWLQAFRSASRYNMIIICNWSRCILTFFTIFNILAFYLHLTTSLCLLWSFIKYCESTPLLKSYPYLNNLTYTLIKFLQTSATLWENKNAKTFNKW